jgi:hypothetical protein
LNIQHPTSKGTSRRRRLTPPIRRLRLCRLEQANRPKIERPPRNNTAQASHLRLAIATALFELVAGRDACRKPGAPSPDQNTTLVAGGKADSEKAESRKQEAEMDGGRGGIFLRRAVGMDLPSSIFQLPPSHFGCGLAGVDYNLSPSSFAEGFLCLGYFCLLFPPGGESAFWGLIGNGLGGCGERKAEAERWSLIQPCKLRASRELHPSSRYPSRKSSASSETSGSFRTEPPDSPVLRAAYTGGTPDAHRRYTGKSLVHPVYLRCTRAGSLTGAPP